MMWRTMLAMLVAIAALWGVASANAEEEAAAEDRSAADAEVARKAPPSRVDVEAAVPPVPDFEPEGAPRPDESIGGATRGGSPKKDE